MKYKIEIEYDTELAGANVINGDKVPLAILWAALQSLKPIVEYFYVVKRVKLNSKEREDEKNNDNGE